MSREAHVLTLFCPDRPGLVAGVARILADQGGNILDAKQFNDTETQRFFMRVAFELVGGATREGFKVAFAHFAAANGMQWSVRGAAQ